MGQPAERPFGAQMESTADLGNEMLEEALCQNAEIEHVFAEHEEFAKYGGRPAPVHPGFLITISASRMA